MSFQQKFYELKLKYALLGFNEFQSAHLAIVEIQSIVQKTGVSYV